MELQLGNEIVGSYKRLAYDPWYALAEFVDNSTQAYFNNSNILDSIYDENSSSLRVEIEYESESHIIVSDNSIGMSKEELSEALIVGKPPADNTGRSKYGLGLKTAACWLGNLWTVETKKLGEEVAHKITFDVNKIIYGDTNLDYKEIHSVNPDDHYTIIKITELNRQFKTRTLSKIRDYLSSMYRLDFKNYGLEIWWQGEKLIHPDIDSFKIKQDGESWFQEINIKLDDSHRKITGWVSVLGDGHRGRQNAGFSIIQSNRVIQGWPKAYKPETIFGPDESNDLVNQRVFGELYMDGFSVSHTKDKIVWEDDNQSLVEDELYNQSEKAIYLAREIRVRNIDSLSILDEQDLFIDNVKTELESNEAKDYLDNINIPSDFDLEKDRDLVISKIVDDQDANSEIYVGSGNNSVKVKVYLSMNSPFEPYVIIELSTNLNSVSIFVNTLHPHYIEMEKPETKENFIRHCVYDGVSEWKAIQLMGEIKPSTVKFIKDGLLRQPFEIKRSFSN